MDRRMLDECIRNGVNERLAPDASISRLARDEKMLI